MIAQFQTLHFQHLGEDQGLIDNDYNTFLTQDSRGFIWVSSMRGPYRFDGSWAKHYPVGTSGAFDQNVQSEFFEDSDGNLWFTTTDGLHQYDPSTDRIESRSISLGAPESEGAFHAFYLDRPNNLLWISDQTRYFRAYDLTIGEMKGELYSTTGMRFEVEPDAMGGVGQLFAYPWLLDTGFELWNFTADEVTKTVHRKGLVGDAHIIRGILESSEIIWLVSDKGLLEYDLKQQEVLAVHQPEGETFTRFWTGIRYDSHSLVLSSRNRGLWFFDTKTRLFRHQVQSDENNPTSLSSNQPRYLYHTADDRLWVSHLGKGWDYSLTDVQPFQNPLAPFGTLPVVDIVEDDRQNVWVLSPRGIYVFSNDLKLLHRIQKVGKEESIANADMHVDPEGVIWVSIDRTLYRLKPSDFTPRPSFQKILELPERVAGIQGLGNGLVLVGTFTGGLLADSEAPENQIARLREAVVPRGVNYFLPGRNGTTLLLQKDNGVKEIRWQQREPTTGQVRGAGRQLNDVHPDSDSTYWLASYTGLIPVSKSNKEKSSQHPEVAFASVLEDEKGIIWAGSNRGIYRYDPTSDTGHFFTQDDGLGTSEFLPRSKLLASDGKVWMGTTDGLVIFHPDSIRPKPSQATVYLDKVWINEKPQPGPGPDTGQQLQLNYFENTVEFEMRTLNLTAASDYRIDYRLINYQNEWTRLKSGNIIRYTQLPPGGYALEVRVEDAKARITPTYRLPLRIRPPFWQTWWFVTLSILALIASVFGIAAIIYQRKLNRQKRLLEEQRAINDERNRIAKELHDDMGSGLSSILFLTEDLLFSIPASGPRRTLDRIKDLAGASLGNMREIIWALDDQQNTVEDLVNRIQRFAKDFSHDAGLRLDFQTELKEGRNVLLNSRRKRDIYLIVKESLHNVAKHANAQQVSVQVRTDTSQLHFQIEDDGKGFDPRGVSHGNGLRNMRDRSERARGEFFVRSPQNGGTIVDIRIFL